MVVLNNDNFEKEVTNTKGTVLVDFYADWCGPCRMLSPIVDKIAEENKDIKVCKLNVDDNEELSRRFGVMSIPTLIVFKDGELKTKSVGLRDKEEVLDMLK